MCKGPGGEAQDSEGACCFRKWVGACQGILERPAATCSKERRVLVRRTQKPALWVTVSWMFFCLTLESEAINVRESPAVIDLEGLNCNGTFCEPWCARIHHVHTVQRCSPWEEPPCVCVTMKSPPWRILGRKVEGEHLEPQPPQSSPTVRAS